MSHWSNADMIAFRESFAHAAFSSVPFFEEKRRFSRRVTNMSAMLSNPILRSTTACAEGDSPSHHSTPPSSGPGSKIGDPFSTKLSCVFFRCVRISGATFVWSTGSSVCGHHQFDPIWINCVLPRKITNPCWPPWSEWKP